MIRSIDALNYHSDDLSRKVFPAYRLALYSLKSNWHEDCNDPGSRLEKESVR
jgi:hypothetical protein